jgi:hypothetical protein
MLHVMGLRTAIVIAAAAVTGIFAATTLIDCAPPTQIVVEVYSDACEGSGKPQAIHRIGIAVGNANAIEEKLPNALHDGCERPATGGVGTLTIYPSGANDAEVAIKVVAGVDTTPDRCLAPGYEGCIAQRRLMKFIPNTTQRAIVRLSLACLNRTCPSGTTCDNGVCKKDQDVLVDGGTAPDADIVEASISEGGVDAGAPDACAGCQGTCDFTECKVDCKKTACNDQNLCAPTLPCKVSCPDPNNCPNILCATTGACTIDCGDGKGSNAGACGNVKCASATCDVTCNGDSACGGDAGIVLQATQSAILKCQGLNACNAASCSGPSCALECNPSPAGSQDACPKNPPCTASVAGGCDKWDNPKRTPPPQGGRN